MSSSIQTTQIDGDIAVGRNMNMGGDAHVAGSQTIEHNLVVKGWLKADNVKQPNCGMFATVEALEAAFPNPKVGLWAVVGDTVPGDIYRCETEGEWTATGETGGVDSIDNVLLYSEQELSSAEKKQARANMGLGDGDIDEDPTAESQNLVKSRGVFGFATLLELGNVVFDRLSLGINGIPVSSETRLATVDFIESSFEIRAINPNYEVRVYTYTDEGEFVNSGNWGDKSASVTKEEGYKYKVSCRERTNTNISFAALKFFRLIYSDKKEELSSLQTEINEINASINSLNTEVSELQTVVGEEDDYVITKDLINEMILGYYTTTVGSAISFNGANGRKCLLISDLTTYKSFTIKGCAGSSGRLYGKIKNGLVTEIGTSVSYNEATIEVDGSFDAIVFNLNILEPPYSLTAERWKDIPSQLASLDNKTASLDERISNVEYFNDKNAAIIGDSSVQASNWAQRMCTNLGFKNWNVFVAGGCTIKTVLTDGILGNCLRKKIEQAIEYIDNTLEGDIGLIMLQIGGNDIGDITGSVESAFENNNYLAYKDNTTTWGSARYCYELLKRKYPNALITVGTVFGRIGSDRVGNAESINNLIREMAWRFCLQVIDGNRYCGFAPILELGYPYYNDGTPGVANDRTNLSRTNPAYNYVDSNNNIVTYEEATTDGVLKEGYSKRYGLYTYDGKHQNLQGEEKVMKFMSQEVRKLLFK